MSRFFPLFSSKPKRPLQPLQVLPVAPPQQPQKPKQLQQPQASPPPASPPAASAPNPLFLFSLPLMKRLFPEAATSRHADLQAIADELNAHLGFYKLDSPVRRAHFFAQILQETGPRLVVEEGFIYQAAVLVNKFSFFQRNPEKACAYGYKDKGTRLKADGKPMARCDFEAIANYAYGGRATLGNGDHASGDGWAFRGRGLKQLTGRYNYEHFQKWHDRWQEHWPQDRVSFMTDPDLLLAMKYAARSAAYFWLVKGLYEIADQGSGADVVDRITRIVNSGTDSGPARRAHFQRLWAGNLMS